MPLMQVKMVQQHGHFSLDTDVLLLCLIIYPEFQGEIIFMTGTENRRRKFQFWPINLALGGLKHKTKLVFLESS